MRNWKNLRNTGGKSEKILRNIIYKEFDEILKTKKH